MDKRIWGPAFWFLLHGWAERLDIGGEDTATEWSRFIRWLADVLPCTICQEHARLQRRPDFSRLRGAALKEAARDWMYQFHTDVNNRLLVGGRTFRKEDLELVYRNRDLTADAQTVLEAIRYGIQANIVRLEAAQAWRGHYERLKLNLGLALPSQTESIDF
jgi:hypothetical protein